MLFAIAAYFGPDAEVQRQKIHERYNEHLRQRTDRVHLAGPLFDANGERTGVLLIIEAVDFPAAQEFLRVSPYTEAGLYSRTEVSEFRPEVGFPR
jgi:uncharacterized protein YciI